ncbi:phospholipid phosphatase-related protein type 3 isoform X1 [Bufo gargarizans]|uniref:phospholipid phosphatase-related protein type 3 isoform X1 n=1 Tax=Bufo gargarizans TaxID=30331 RepID=UPI001CF243A5|nr:phospholipid phosphatase-related protein type 3 isoform X1 [Bufo gargarizans]
MISPKEKSKVPPPKNSMTLLPCFYFVELPIVASSIVSLYFLELTDVFRPAQGGFQCHDRSLSMPYVETNEELIPLLMLLSLAFAAPAASIMVGEGVLYCIQSKLKGHGSSEGSINAGGCNFNSFLRRTVRFVGVHVFGLCATALVTDVIQLATGYHAPFFLTVCKPNYTRLGASCATNPYITQDICTGNDHHAILSARKTFPSQHATLSAFAAVYVSVSILYMVGTSVYYVMRFISVSLFFQMYFNSIISDSTKLLKPLLVFAFSIAAGVCGLTQITQYRSHPVDVYAGFLIGSGIAAYLAYHAVGNFRASSEDTSPKASKDLLHALTHRGHESVYHQNKSSSTDELTPLPRTQATQRQVQREKNSLGSLKRASVDVDLLAPRSPMGKENMVTFSNTLPRVSTPSMEDTARRHMTIHVPAEGTRPPRGPGAEWKPKPLEGRSLTLGEEVALAQAHRRAASETSGIILDEPDPDRAPPSLYPTVQARAAGPRVLIQPRPAAPPLLHIPEENQTGSPKGSSAIRAKWMMMAEKGGVPRASTNAPRLMQVIAMSKQQQQQVSSLVSSTPKHSETSSSSTTSSSDSSQYRSPSERDSSSIVTIDAHAPHHPVVHLSSGNGPWEWKAAQKPGEIQETGTYDMSKDYRGYRTPKGAGVSPGSSISDLEPDSEPRCGPTVNVAGGVPTPLIAETIGIPSSREASLRRKPQVAEREGSEEAEEPFYKKLQNQRFKE